MRKREIVKNRGMTMVFLAIVLTVLIGMTALAIDIAQLYLAAQRGQDVSDSAALAGAAYLTGQASCTAVDNSSGTSTPSDGAAARAAKDVAASNNILSTFRTQHPDNETTGVKVTFPTGTITGDDGRPIQVALGQAIRVDCETHVDYRFARIFGLTGADVPASATALLEQKKLLTSNYFAPWCVADTTVWNVGTTPPTPILPLGAQVTLLVDDWPDGFIGPGNYGSVAYDGDRGGNDYRNRIAGTAPPVTVGVSGEPGSVEVWTEPGKKVGPFRQGMEARLNKPGEPWPSPSADSRAWNEWVASFNPARGTVTPTWRLIVVPVIRDRDYGGGRKQLEVVGFAAMFIDSYTASGNDLSLTGRFIQAVVVGESISWLPGGSTPSQTNLFSGIKLVS